MADREKVIDGLNETISYLRLKTGSVVDRCIQHQYDALELLREKEPVKPVDVHWYQKMYVNVRSGYCPICNNPVDEEEGNNFCCTCGRRLKWDD